MGETLTTLTAAQAAFIEGPRSMYAAGRDAALRPSLARVLGVQVSTDRRQLLLFVHPQQAAALLRDVDASGELAVVFNAPESHQTLQLKGHARRVPLPVDAAPRIEAHLRAFVEVLQPMGFTPEQILTIVRGTPETPVALAFAPAQAYEQTPGPHAGERVATAR